MAYEQGQQSRIAFVWDDAAGQLTIGKQQGSYPGMNRKRQFHVVLNGQSQTVNYDGKKLIINLKK